ncbi:LCP family protein [Liquorilactobacillus nagelii]|uniref:LCP family glycopolymer transferase n=1 Tax=Liquorilactobacillus nagelii TaxID=82688 RepID=UPI0006F0DE00|nr:LCP family protein [Liquorilactobacillus nagelii]KRL42004.1 LytR family transcriptional regulator [Liquorilactobacillus nagelii DSM 13675]QYH54611.1 LytR family transcriptional regulator [Liquorilactobacillus nagelii DSM 13675]
MNKRDQQDQDYLETPLRRNPNHNSHQKTANHARLRKACAFLLLISLVAFYGVGLYAYHMLGAAKTTINETYKKTNVKKLRNVSDVLQKKKPFSILLLGTDTGALGRTDKGRTDTIIIATVNPQTKRTTLTSIPRDTQVKVPGSENSYDKINSAYTIGGVSTAIKTVQNSLHIPIDFYLLINMGGLRKLVDAVGGITIKPLLTFNYSYAHVTKGKTVTLNGKQALAYSRMRYSDPEGDYGRQKRQKQVIKAIVSKAMSSSTISNYKQILNTLQNNMQTDLSYNDMLTIETNYKSAASSIKSDVLQGEDATINGLSYQVATAKEKQKISDNIRSELGLDPSTETFIGRIDQTFSDDDDSYSSSTTNYNSYSNNNNGYNNYRGN